MMLRLQNYHFTVQYKKGKELFVAETLSRVALSDGPESPSGMTQEYDVFRVDLTQIEFSPNLVKPGTMNQIREETVKDPQWCLVAGPPGKKLKYPLKSEPTGISEMGSYMMECSSYLMKSKFPHHCDPSSYRRYTSASRGR